MIHWLHALPDGVVFAGAMGLVGTAMLAAPWFGARVLHVRHDPRREELSFDAFKSVAATTSMILSFSLVQVDGNLRNEQVSVGREAAMVSATDRELSYLGDAQVPELRRLLRLCAARIVADEWPKMLNGGRSQEVDALFEDLSGRLAALEPANEREQVTISRAINDVEQLEGLRGARLAAAKLYLPQVYWCVIAILVSLMLALATLSAPSSPRSLAAAVIGAAIGLLIALVAVVDGPFDGAVGVGPLPLQQAMIRSIDGPNSRPAGPPARPSNLAPTLDRASGGS